MNTKLTAAAALLLAAAPAWAINKCLGPGGQPVYQDAPCAGQGSELVVHPASGNGDPAAVVRAQGELSKARLQNAIGHGIATGQPVPGMTASQLQQTLGAPSKVNTGNYGGSHQDQWIFYKPGGTWYVYTTNGIVTSTQFSEGSGPGVRAAQQHKNCPSELELRNLKVSASKLKAEQTEIMAYQSALDRQRDCEQ